MSRKIRRVLAVAVAMAGCVALAEVNVFDVRDFGAKGNGKTPDSAAIQKAIDAAGRVKGTVWFPAGEYPCHDLKVPPHVMLKGDPVWIFQAKKCGAVLQLDEAKARCVLDITGAFGVHIYGLMLSGIGSTPAPVHGILLGNEKKFSPKEDSVFIDDCKVMNFSGHGAYLNRVWMFTIRHSQFMNNAGCGVMIYGWDGFVTDNMFSANRGGGFGCEECGATVMFTANRVEWNGRFGLHAVNGDAWNITGNSFDRDRDVGLWLENVSASTVTGNLFRRCGGGEKDCQASLSRCSGVSFVGNTARAGRDDGGKGQVTPRYGIVVERLSDCVISGNTLSHGYLEQMIVDKGGHGEGVVLRDNVGRPLRGAK